jgi:hypothetical protein
VAHLVLVQEKCDLRQCHGTVDATPRRQGSRGQRGKTRPEAGEVRIFAR